MKRGLQSSLDYMKSTRAQQGLPRFERLNQLATQCGSSKDNEAPKAACLRGMAAELGMDMQGYEL
eukprot:CAMPEP_0117690634 /NCGR_PEP_ID=MMETSP0804-20121206/25238_1 /TAXON_ID=1074897 /ORGANISM="Tetraselmis astigmatica, Strain CCMP880" /LENGTH=64 /DNA_ID=CAMNT_0005503707 /DNA_START=218 /DNA_END=412 /DNA_ORIENTATION=-